MPIIWISIACKSQVTYIKCVCMCALVHECAWCSCYAMCSSSSMNSSQKEGSATGEIWHKFVLLTGNAGPQLLPQGQIWLPGWLLPKPYNFWSGAWCHKTTQGQPIHEVNWSGPLRKQMGKRYPSLSTYLPLLLLLLSLPVLEKEEVAERKRGRV